MENLQALRWRSRVLPNEAAQGKICYFPFKYLSNHATVRWMASIRFSRLLNPSPRWSSNAHPQSCHLSEAGQQPVPPLLLARGGRFRLGARAEAPLHYGDM